MRLSTLAIRVEALLDCRDASLMGLTPDDLLHDTDYLITQQLGAAAVELGVEGVLVPSATLFGDNIVLWVSLMRPGSRLTIVKSEDPRLYVPRP